MDVVWVASVRNGRRRRRCRRENASKPSNQQRAKKLKKKENYKENQKYFGWADKLNASGVIIYNTHTHIDKIECILQ